MARNEQLIRQHKLLHLLEESRYGRTLTELRDELVDALGLTNLSERTVRRDLEALQAAGFEILAMDGARGQMLPSDFLQMHEPRLAAYDAVELTGGALRLVARKKGVMS